MRYVATIQIEDSGYLDRITDLDIATVDGNLVLISATYNTGGLATFGITDAELAVVQQAQWTYPQIFGHMGDPELVSLVLDGQDYLTLVGLGSAAGYKMALDGSGELGTMTTLYPDNRLPGDLIQLGQFQMGGSTYIYAARQGQVTFDVYRQGADGSLTLTDSSYMPTAANMPHASLDKMISVQMGNETVVIAISGLGNFLSSQRIGPDGQIIRSDYLKVGDGTGFNVPDDVAAVTVGGQVYLIVTSNRSSSITTLRLLPDGSMVAVDHVVDELTTRFQGATALATAEIDGRAFVFVGGVDDGITMFSVLPDGRLLHVTTLADDDLMTLQNVSAITAEVVDGQIVLFVASATETGITQLVVDPGQIGQTVKATAAGQVAGTNRDDMLRAGRETTHLRGGDGDDVLIAHDQSIMMWGGAGRDTFVATAVNGRILIWDFDPNEDQLDLTQLGMIRSTGQLKFSPFSKGIRIWFGDTLIEIHSAHGGTLSPDLFTNAMFPITHYTPPQVETIIVGSDRNDILQAARGGSEVYGMDGNDVLLGGLVEDLLSGGNGNDTMSGGSGNDTLLGGEGHDRMRGGSGNDLLEGEFGHDMLIGDAGDDTLTGGDGSDTLFGGPGHDSLTGGEGDDYLSGDDGNDTLLGQAGHDSLSGGAGHDLLTDQLGDNIMSGGAGNDTLTAGDGADILSGGDGDDLIQAGAGDDMLDGGVGDDTIIAGAGNDQIAGGSGDDSLRGDTGDDRIAGDGGHDTLAGGGGQDTLSGGDGDDLISGDDGNDNIHAGAGDDTAAGGPGDDLIHGDAGADTLVGGLGNDTLVGGSGFNQIFGGADRDLLQGDSDRDLIYGEAGNDTLFGHGGDDVLEGGDGADILVGGSGNDLISGGTGGDRLIGGEGHDSLLGDAGNDDLDGGEGDDVLTGGAGADLLAGGLGADRFVFLAASDSAPSNSDRISDFQHDIDVIDLTALDLVFIADQDFSAPGQLRIEWVDDYQLLEADLDGDGLADMTIRIDSRQAIAQDDLLL